MHLARGAGCPGVIVFGGRLSPDQAGYEGFLNISRNPTCSPCWRYTGCEFDHQCMHDITPAEVITVTKNWLAATKPPLPNMVINLTNDEQQRIAKSLTSTGYTLNTKPAR